MARARPLEIPAGYEVLRDGTIVSHRCGVPRELRQRLNGSANGRGYPSVELYYRDKQGVSRKLHVAVYRLVAACYLPPRPSLAHYILHKDGNHMHSGADNLAWGTASENTYDAWRHRRERERGLLGVDSLF